MLDALSNEPDDSLLCGDAFADVGEDIKAEESDDSEARTDAETEEEEWNKGPNNAFRDVCVSEVVAVFTVEEEGTKNNVR